MIIDSLEHIDLYRSLNPLFAQAIDFLKSTDLQKLQVGKQELNGKDLMVTVAQSKPKVINEARLEAHKQYIDIQIPLSGAEIMGYTPLEYCIPRNASYDRDNDITFFEGHAETYFTIKPGMFAIFFPWDGHAPAITQVDLKKIIIKVKA